MTNGRIELKIFTFFTLFTASIFTVNAFGDNNNKQFNKIQVVKPRVTTRTVQVDLASPTVVKAQRQKEQLRNIVATYAIKSCSAGWEPLTREQGLAIAD